MRFSEAIAQVLLKRADRLFSIAQKLIHQSLHK